MDSQSPPERNKLLILGTCCASILMVGLDVTVLNVALPSLQRDFNAPIQGLQWTMDAYTIVIGSLLITSGSAADRIGRKAVFQAGLVVFTLGSLLCGLSPGLGWFIAFRVLQAIGGSMLNPVAMGIISNTFTKQQERARAIGVWGGVAGVSMAAGPVLGGVLLQTVGWRAIFWINVPIGLGALALTWLHVPESRSPVYRAADFAGQALVIGLFACLVFSIIEGPQIGWENLVTIAGFVISGLCLIGLLIVESRRDDPLIDLRFFASAPFAGATSIALMAFFCLGGFLFFTTLYLQDALGLTPLRAGLYLLPMAAAMAFFSPASGFMLGRFGPRVPLTLGAVALLAAMAILAEAGPHLSMTTLFTGFVLAGLGIGMANAALTHTAVSGMPRSQSGLAAAMLSAMRQVGQALGVATTGSILATIGGNAAGPRYEQAWSVCWWALAGCAAVVLTTALATTGAWGRRTAERVAARFSARAGEGPDWARAAR